MKREFSKVVSIVLVLTFLVSIFSINVSAATYSGSCGRNVRWSLNTSTGVLSLTGSGDTYDYGYDTEWSGSAQFTQGWYNYRNYIKTVAIGENIYKLGNYLFYELYNLEQVDLPKSLEYIGSSVFAECVKLKKVNIPENVVYIGVRAFESCPIENIVLPTNIEEIGAYAFCGNKAKELVIPSYVKLGEGVFGSDTIEDITIGYGVDVLNAIGGYPKNIYLETLSQWTNIEWPYATYPTEGVKIYVGGKLVSDSVFNEEHIETINDFAFYGYDWFTNLDIPQNVKYIGNWAFKNCKNLKTVVSKAGYIGACAFEGCINLTDAIIEYGDIGEAAFSGCTNLQNVTIDARKIEEHAFNSCSKLEEVVLYEAVEEIGWGTFYECASMKNIKIYNSNCIINDSEATIPSTAIIYGWRNSTAEQYATKYNREFVAFDDICEHNMIIIKSQEATCTASGYTVLHCSKCEHIELETEDVLGHNFGEFKVVQNATCTDVGLKNAVCSVCDETVESIIPATGHDYETVVTAPTCTEQGYTTHTCECGDTYVDDYVDTIGHTPADSIEENYIAPTCSSNGSVDKVVYCSVCDEELGRETETIEMLGHTDNDGDGYCDIDNELLDLSVECDCNCHKSGISKFFFDFILFFQRLFGSNKACACGVAHY